MSSISRVGKRRVKKQILKSLISVCTLQQQLFFERRFNKNVSLGINEIIVKANAVETDYMLTWLRETFQITERDLAVKMIKEEIGL